MYLRSGHARKVENFGENQIKNSCINSNEIVIPGMKIWKGDFKNTS